MTRENTNQMTPYNLHVGDWVYVRNKCFWPVRIASMDDFEIATVDGDIYKYEELGPVRISRKTIEEFSLPCKDMTIKGKEGDNYWFCVRDYNGETWDFKANSIHVLQHNYYEATSLYLRLKWRGANL